MALHNLNTDETVALGEQALSRCAHYLFGNISMKKQVQVQVDLDMELQEVEEKHPGDGVLQLQLAAGRLTSLFKDVHFDLSKAMASATMTAAAQPWEDSATPFQDSLLRCARRATIAVGHDVDIFTLSHAVWSRGACAPGRALDPENSPANHGGCHARAPQLRPPFAGLSRTKTTPRLPATSAKLRSRPSLHFQTART
jgi:hypothetical protein